LYKNIDYDSELVLLETYIGLFAARSQHWRGRGWMAQCLSAGITSSTTTQRL